MFKGLWEQLGLRSSFRLQGGVYYADTDFEGQVTQQGPILSGDTTGSLSLSHNKTAFIGGLTLETKKRLGKRFMLSLRSKYEYYSYVPEMSYSRVDLDVGLEGVGHRAGTSIGNAEAFSMQTSLRLSIKLSGNDQ